MDAWTLKDWIQMLAPVVAAMAGGLFGVRMGIAKLRGETAFVSRLAWYQVASEASLELRYAIQEAVSVVNPGSEASREDVAKAWADLETTLDVFLDVIPKSHMFARASTYRKLRRAPVMARELLHVFSPETRESVGDSELRLLIEFKSYIAMITRIMTDDLRTHLGLKGLSRPKGVRAWYEDKRIRWADDHPLADVLEAWGWKVGQPSTESMSEAATQDE